VNPDTAACDPARIVELDARPFTGTIGPDNIVAGNCTAVDRNETILHFAPTDFPLMRITFSEDTGISAISVRTTCDVPTSELGCNTFGDTVIDQVAAGTDLFVVVENETSGAFTLGVTIEETLLLNTGDACDPANDLQICPAGDVCIDATGGTAPTCTTPETVTLSGSLDNGTDATWSRFNADCAVADPVHVTPFDRYTLTNNTAAALTAIIEITSVGDPTVCPFDTFLHVTGSPVDPPTATIDQCIEGDDDDGVGACSLIQRSIPAGASVDAVVSAFSDGRGAYDLRVRSFGGALDLTAD